MHTATEVRAALSYNPATGLFVWKRRPEVSKSWNTRWAGKPALTALQTKGYYCGHLNGKPITAHRAAWLSVHDDVDGDEIDHINGVKTDNRIDNLRVVSRSLNKFNHAGYANNATGFRGVDRPYKRWRARIGGILIGSFDTYEEAVAARLAYEKAHNITCR